MTPIRISIPAQIAPKVPVTVPTFIPAWTEVPKPTFVDKPAGKVIALEKGVNTLLTPGQTYAVKATLNGPANCGLSKAGPGPDPILQWIGPANGAMFRIRAVSDSWFDGFTIDGNGKNVTAFQVNADNVTVKNVTAQNGLQNFFKSEGAPDFQPVSHHIRIFNCKTLGKVYDYGIGLFGATEDVVVDGFQFSEPIANHNLRAHGVKKLWVCNCIFRAGINPANGKLNATLNDRDGEDHYHWNNHYNGPGGWGIGPLADGKSVDRCIVYSNTFDQLSEAVIYPGVNDLLFAENHLAPKTGPGLSIWGATGTRKKTIGVFVGNRHTGIRGIEGGAGSYFFDNKPG